MNCFITNCTLVCLFYHDYWLLLADYSKLVRHISVARDGPKTKLWQTIDQ